MKSRGAAICEGMESLYSVASVLLERAGQIGHRTGGACYQGTT